MKKGCLIAFGTVCALMFLAVGGCYILATRYEKEPKPAGYAELMEAENVISIYREKVGFGSDDEARAIAKQYSLVMKVMREMFFSGHDSKNFSLSKGEFVTYCNLEDDKCAFIVHVPQLRNYTPEAKQAMGEMAWETAVNILRENKVEVKDLAVGIRGSIDFGRILVGTLPPKGSPKLGVKLRTDDYRVLLPFFAEAQAPATDAKK